MSLVRIVSTTALTSLVLFANACSTSDNGGNGGAGNPSSTSGGSSSGGTSSALGGNGTATSGGQASGGTNANSGGTQASGGGGASASGGSTSGGSTSGGSAQSGGSTSGPMGGATTAGGSSSQAGAAGNAGSGPLGGYHVHGDWSGFAFTYGDGGATITPDKETGFKTMTDKDGPYCAKGTILGDYSSIAAIGFNTKQEKMHDAPAGKVVPSGTGLLVNISNPGKSASLRVQIEDGTDPKAADAAMHRWCVNLSEFDKDVVIPWASFNTECWAGGKGTAFNPTTPLGKAQVFLPSDGKTTLNFDFCVNKIGPDKVTGRGTGTLGSSCDNTVSWPSSNITGQYDNVATGDGKYHFQSNGWGWTGGGSHTVGLSTSCGFKMNSQTCNRTDKIPCSYPSIYIGTSADGKRSSGNGLPKLVSSITSAPVCMGWSAGGGANDEYNVSFDVWFNSNANATNADTFLMVWYRKPPSFQPAGSPKADGVVIAGQPWTVWYGPNADGQNVVSYLAPTTFANGQAFSFDLKDFIDDAVERNYLSASKNLISVFGGMEIWGGGSGAAITHFKAEVK